MAPAADHPDEGVVDANTAIMQSLAHPMRMRLLSLLRTYGPSTATKLAGRIGESSGLTSYHLRQLASAGLVTEAEPGDLAGVRQTGGRERWWKAAHRGTRVIEMPGEADQDGMAAMESLIRTLIADNSAAAQRWLSDADRWSREWQEVSSFSDYALRLTTAETRQLVADLDAVVAKYRRHDYAGEMPPDTVVVVAQMHVFPNGDQDPPSKSD